MSRLKFGWMEWLSVIMIGMVVGTAVFVIVGLLINASQSSAQCESLVTFGLQSDGKVAIVIPGSNISTNGKIIVAPLTPACQR